jgi:hypothetical protein
VAVATARLRQWGLVHPIARSVQKADCNMVTHGIAAMHRDNVVTVRAETHVVDRRSGIGRLMVKIRYSELPAGLHVAAAADHEDTVVYLQPGLTSAQRRAALIRVRSSARIGQGPALPRPAMARAIAADRVRTNARIGAAAARRHPMLFLPPVFLLVISAIAFLLMSIQPLTVTNQGSVTAGLPTLHVRAQNTPTPPPSQPASNPRHHRRDRAAASPLTHPRSLQPSLPAACAALRAMSGRGSLPAPPSRSNSVLSRRCLRRFQRWLRTHRS